MTNELTLTTLYDRIEDLEDAMEATLLRTTRQWHATPCTCLSVGTCDHCKQHAANGEKYWTLDDKRLKLLKLLRDEFTPTAGEPGPRDLGELIGLVEEDGAKAYDSFSPEEKEAWDAYAQERQDEWNAFMEGEATACMIDADVIGHYEDGSPIRLSEAGEYNEYAEF